MPPWPGHRRRRLETTFQSQLHHLAPAGAGIRFAAPSKPEERRNGDPDMSELGRLLARRRIPVVEDEMMLALDIEMALLDAGAEVIGPAGNPGEALALAEGDRPIDAAILDVDLRGEEVFPVAERLRDRGVPFLFHTGHATRAELAARFENAMVCTKPVLSEDLVARVATLF